LALLDDDTFIAADNGHNLVRAFCKKRLAAQHAGSLPAMWAYLPVLIRKC
jgi:hypothetical protein